MNVRLNTQTHLLNGDQQLTYYNNSPDTLYQVYYHLYFNAFQPNSMMDVRSRTIADADRRVGDRISKLTPQEIGYQKIISLLQDGKPLSYTVNETILEVALAKPLPPKSKTVFQMVFEAQVPIQIRRSGRDNREGISYSMTQWYPKIAEYDFQGWHAYPYVAREFHSVWGDFEVTITIDPAFTVAATGKLQNPDKVGYGYQTPGTEVTRMQQPVSWRFIAKDVIDFAWAADPDYIHDRVQVPDGPELHFFYQNKLPATIETWKAMQPLAVKVFQHLNKTFGKYPFDTYSIIQGGDGGMEYPMCTLILGDGKLEGVAGTMAHEVAHSWYQMALASNEALYAWMDEGFTDFASEEAMDAIAGKKSNHASSYANYFQMVANNLLEAPSQHSDHFTTNRGYRTGSYTAGAIFLHQLKYIIGEQNFYTGMRRYYNTWKMRHPEPNDFMRVMEKVSGLQLHWYLRYWIYTTKKIDYAIAEVKEDGRQTQITLNRIGEMPMPIELWVTYKDGSKELVYLPLNEMLGEKPAEDDLKRTVLKAWPWVNPTYTFKLARAKSEIDAIEIDPGQHMADINRKNNKMTAAELGVALPTDNR